jgi:hypothetical protein
VDSPDPPGNFFARRLARVLSIDRLKFKKFQSLDKKMPPEPFF